MNVNVKLNKFRFSSLRQQQTTDEVTDRMYSDTTKTSGPTTMAVEV